MFLSLYWGGFRRLIGWQVWLWYRSEFELQSSYAIKQKKRKILFHSFFVKACFPHIISSFRFISFHHKNIFRYSDFSDFHCGNSLRLRNFLLQVRLHFFLILTLIFNLFLYARFIFTIFNALPHNMNILSYPKYLYL